MVTISCTCGAVTFATGNPVRTLSLRERLDLVTHRVRPDVVVLAPEPEWHPGGASLAVDCVALVAEVGLSELVASLSTSDAAAVHAAWHLPREHRADTDAPTGDVVSRTA